ncbi:MAG: zinc dependent phospholipase C family protein [Rectinemataceae bacterium]|jgi:hypothetical protein
MAAQISHIIAGEQAFEKVMGRGSLGDDASLRDAAPFFRFGCQGPDIFYHNQRTKPSGLHYGALAHRRRFGSLVAGAAAAIPKGERVPESPAGAYLLGLATHAAIDRATHPFIIYFSGWVDPSDPSTERFRGCHSFLERLLDMGLLERRLGLSPGEYGLSARLGLDHRANTRAHTRGGLRADKAIIALWEAGLRAAYPRATGADSYLDLRIGNALADARHFYKATDPAATAAGGRREDWIGALGGDEGRRLIPIVYPENAPKDMDTMNESGAEWEHPSGDGRRSKASYPELIDEGSQAAAQAISLVLCFWQDGISASMLAASLGEGGLALFDADGAVVPPRLCRPLALPEAIRAEYARRIDGHVDVSAKGRYDAQHEHEG